MTSHRRASLLLSLIVAAASAVAPPAIAAESGGAAPAAFDVVAAATPVFISASAPSAVPLDAEAAVARSSVKLNSQPSGTAEASPGYVPLYGALPLLGGIGALPAIGARLAPGLLVGFPTIVGLPPVPLDPTLVPTIPVPQLPSPELPPIECFATAPGEATSTSCGGPTQDVLGFSMGAASGTVSSAGDSADPSTLRVDSAVRGAGFGPSSTNSILPVSAGTVASAASSSIKDGRVVAGVSTAVDNLAIGGIIKIPAINTSLAVALDGTATNASVSADRCTIAGATVAGVPVEIDGDGVHVATTNQSLAPVVDQLNSTVNTALTQLGVTLKTFAGSADPGVAGATSFPGQLTVAEDGTKVSASLACLEMSYRVPTSGTVVTLTFGSATVTAQAFSAQPTRLPSGPSTPAGSVASGTSAASGTGASHSPSLAGSGSAPPGAPTPGTGAPAPSAVAFQAASFGWSIPYPPFAFLALALPLLIWGRRASPVAAVHRRPVRA